MKIPQQTVCSDSFLRDGVMFAILVPKNYCKSKM